MVPLRPHMWKGRRTNESRDDVVARKLVPADQPSRKGLCHGVLRRKWNGGDTPRLTIGQPGDSAAGWAFAIDLTGRCTLQDTEGYVAALEPDCGLYDLGQLAWTFQHITARYSHTGTSLSFLAMKIIFGVCAGGTWFSGGSVVLPNWGFSGSARTGGCGRGRRELIGCRSSR